ncbi:MepB family protein [Pedobacter hiemivivus]|uniref:MepB domain containing protein n=1 Tax=Pedobacter hiemivivus TaxID=2530454 RepID=A0A4R0MLH7_9SPHI|nr:MepB family protein [Pedobacter hiemivivus]TCC87403.1 MepB domain containing protein [Pedobacter hiemivivus]
MVEALSSDLILAQQLVYIPCGYSFTAASIEIESSDYNACEFKLDGLAIRFRVAKITPTKIGQFVTIWKRSDNGPIEPYSISDKIDFLIVSTRKADLLGQFIFPKTVLLKKGVLSTPEREGKRAIRVYPPWDEPTSKQARQTQQWQLDYFLAIPIDQSNIDLERAKMLLK